MKAVYVILIYGNNLGSNCMKIACIIPARMKSTRFPGKPLAPIDGVPMIVRTYERVKSVGYDWSDLCIATDSHEIVAVCKDFEIPTIMTRPDHPTGTDRIYEAVQSLDCDYVINVQGDEPIIPQENIMTILQIVDVEKGCYPPEVINALTEATPEEVANPNIIKAVTYGGSANGYLMYMSRYGVPYPKSNVENKWYKQVCIYGFSLEALNWFYKFGLRYPETIEGIEILRFLQDPRYIPRMVEVNPGSISVDVPEDVLKVEAALSAGY